MHPNGEIYCSATVVASFCAQYHTPPSHICILTTAKTLQTTKPHPPRVECLMIDSFKHAREPVRAMPNFNSLKRHPRCHCRLPLTRSSKTIYAR